MRHVLATAALAGLVTLTACSGGDDPAAGPTAGTPRASVSEDTGEPVPITPDGVDVTELDDGAVGVADVDGEAWTALIDAGQVLTGDGTRVDVGTAPLRLVDTPDGVWVSVISDGRIVRVDPASGEVDLRVRLRPAGSEPEGLAYADGILWVVDQAHDRLVPVDSTTGDVGEALDVGGAPRLVSAGTGGPWVSNYGGGSVSRVLTTVDSLPSPRVTTRRVPHCLGPQGLAEAGGVIWVACTIDGKVVGLDARTLQPVVTLDGLAGADAVVADGDTVYAIGQQGPTVWAIDASTRKVVTTLVLDDAGGTSENVGAAVVGTDLVVTHPDARRRYDVPLRLLTG